MAEICIIEGELKDVDRVKDKFENSSDPTLLTALKEFSESLPKNIEIFKLKGNFLITEEAYFFAEYDSNLELDNG